MSAKDDASAPTAIPGHVILLEDWGAFLAGRVLAVDEDRYAQLELEGAKFRPASEREVSLAGVAA